MVDILTPAGQTRSGGIGAPTPTVQRIRATPLRGAVATGGEAAGQRLQQLGAFGQEFANRAYALEVDNKLMEIEQGVHNFELDMFHPESGLLQRKGASARGVAAEAKNRAETFRKELLDKSGLHGTARQTAEEYLQSKVNAYEKRALEHETAQARAHRRSLIAAREEQLQDQAALAILNGDTAAFDSLLVGAVGASDTAAEADGISGAARDQRAEKAATKIVATGIDAHLAQGDPVAAWDLYNAYADQMDPTDRVKIEANLRPVAEREVRRQYANSEANALMASGVSYEEAVASIRDEGRNIDLDTQTELLAEYNRRVGEQDEIEKRARAANSEQALELAITGQLNNLDPVVRAELPPGELATLQMIDGGYAPIDNPVVKAELEQLSWDELQEVDLPSFQGELSPQTYQQLMAVQSNPPDTQAVFTDGELINNVAQEAGYQADNQVVDLQNELRRYSAEVQQKEGRIPSEPEKLEHLRNYAGSDAVPQPKISIEPVFNDQQAINNALDQYGIDTSSRSGREQRGLLRRQTAEWLQTQRRLGDQPDGNAVADYVGFLLSDSPDRGGFLGMTAITQSERLQQEETLRIETAATLGVEPQTYDALVQNYLDRTNISQLTPELREQMLVDLQSIVEIMRGQTQ